MMPAYEPEDGNAIAVTDLTKRFVLPGRWMSKPVIVHAVESVTLAAKAGTTLGIVGESGCGKTTLGRMVAGLLTPTQGWIEIGGVRIGPREVARKLRGRVQMVFQDPYSSLDPRMTVGASVAESLGHVPRDRARHQTLDMLERVGLPSSFAKRLPHELSGGQQQRACIARALVGGQRVIVLDEIVSALDPIIRANTLDLLLELRRDLGLTYLFISHDLFAVRVISTHVAVMYLGELVEYAPIGAFRDGVLAHPYSVALLASRLDLSAGAARPAAVLAGDVPSPLDRPNGCVFRTRCLIARAVCAARQPELREMRPGHYVACYFAGELN